MTDEGVADNIASTATPKDGVKKYTDKIRTHDGLSGPVEFPEAAPLVFPELDWLIENGNAEQTQKLGKYKKFRKFVADYYDRRAQAEYVSSRNIQCGFLTNPSTGFQEPNQPTCSATKACIHFKIWRSDRLHESVANFSGDRRPRSGEQRLVS